MSEEINNGVTETASPAPVQVTPAASVLPVTDAPPPVQVEIPVVSPIAAAPEMPLSPVTVTPEVATPVVETPAVTVPVAPAAESAAPTTVETTSNTHPAAPVNDVQQQVQIAAQLDQQAALQQEAQKPVIPEQPWSDKPLFPVAEAMTPPTQQQPEVVAQSPDIVPLSARKAMAAEAEVRPSSDPKDLAAALGGMTFSFGGAALSDPSIAAVAPVAATLASVDMSMVRGGQQTDSVSTQSVPVNPARNEEVSVAV